MDARFGVRTVIAMGVVFAAGALLPSVAHAEAEPVCTSESGSIPDPTVPAGTPNPKIPIEHVVVMMQENHSFNNVFGRLNEYGYGDQIDGVLPETHSNPDTDGSPVHPYLLKSYCVRDTEHGWNASWKAWNEGKNDQFVLLNHGKRRDGARAMGYYEQKDMPFYYSIANNFAVADRFFASVLGPTYPNRFYLLTGTSFGHIRNKFPKPFKEFTQKTIFETLNENGVSWKYYYSDLHMLLLFQKLYWKNLKNIAPISQFKRDMRKGRMPQVVFLESSVIMGDEHPPFNFQISQYFVAKRIKELMLSKYWKKSALFLVYDEGGGYFDHVSPPKACVPDAIPPLLENGDVDAQFDRFGFRVPFVAVSPWVKRHYVSHVTYDHTSILKFIETKFNLPALTKRDANADPMLDLFDFDHPNFEIPQLPKPSINWKRFAQCFNPFHKSVNKQLLRALLD